MIAIGNRSALLRAAADMPPHRARMVLAAIIAGDGTHRTDRTDVTHEAAAAFEADMRPVREAIVSALEAGDMEALRGLRALLPHLLAEVNQEPALADLLAHQLGKSLLAGLRAAPEDTL